MRGRELPVWGKAVFRLLAQLVPIAVALAGACALAHDALSSLFPFRKHAPPTPPPVFVDTHVVASAALALAAGVSLFQNNRGGRAATRESGALLIGLAVIAGFVFYSSTYFARRGDLSRSYEGLARDVWPQVGSRRLLLYHANDSWSGTFAFLARRTTPEFNEMWDPRGEHLLAELGPVTSDVVLAPSEALKSIDESRRRELVVEWSGWREEDRGNPEKLFVLVHREARKP